METLSAPLEPPQRSDGDILRQVTRSYHTHLDKVEDLILRERMAALVGHISRGRLPHAWELLKVMQQEHEQLGTMKKIFPNFSYIVKVLTTYESSTRSAKAA